MKSKVSKKRSAKSFEREYKAIMKDMPPTTPFIREWAINGDSFVQFSLYQNHPTTASPNTQA